MSCYCKVPMLFLTVPWVGLQFVIVVFPDHSHLLFGCVFRGRGLREQFHLFQRNKGQLLSWNKDNIVEQ